MASVSVIPAFSSSFNAPADSWSWLAESSGPYVMNIQSTIEKLT
jgi:hypothetical protein